VVTIRLRLPAVDDPDFIADVDYKDGATLRLIGSADTTAVRELATLLQALHAELIGKRVRAVVVDMRELDFMAAGCVRELVAWFAALEPIPAAERYKIRLRSNPAIEWQRHTLPALSCFDTGLVTVET
jgi:hypothetical protein